jgi:hypothetical protein
MARKQSKQTVLRPFVSPVRQRKRRALFLSRYVNEAAGAASIWPLAQRASETLKKWAKLEKEGRLRRKETSVDAEFLHEVFGLALGYQRHTEGSEIWNLERNYAVPGIGVADGALGLFRQGNLKQLTAVIELKGADVDLDRDKSGGRTPVQQCWDYLNALPQCPWAIVSNYRTTRLYHRDKTQLAYEEFSLAEFLDEKSALSALRRIVCVLGKGGLLADPHEPRAIKLLRDTETRQKTVGVELYDDYRQQRHRLVHHLMTAKSKSQEQAIHIAQKILDRIIFVAFCEDRDLLPSGTIRKAYSSLPPFSKVTNPRWKSFLDLFESIDKGHPNLELSEGYNGGLFRHDPDVDNLELSDEWTTFFNTIGNYDFRDEVNVDVLGQIFEQSITELEKFRAIGLFSDQYIREAGADGAPAMSKSAERKRFGVYYTPPEFTRYIVETIVVATIEERLRELRARFGYPANQTPEGATAEFWRSYIAELRAIKVCDPACGSGAFLIEAYDRLEEYYVAACEHLWELGDTDAIEHVADYILHDNLYGVDLSPQAVEITQLALWVRSARKGKTLEDLSRNIVCRNSLVSDPAVHPGACTWKELFREVFERAAGGFDCVIGNPPWERLKLQEREFFAFRAPKIASAVNAASRRQMVAKLERGNPALNEEYVRAKAMAEATLEHVRTCGSFPLTGKGDVNTYALFAELANSIVAPNGRVGLLVPSGIATDSTTKEFFELIGGSGRLDRFYDFENKLGLFPDVHRSFKFSILAFGGELRVVPKADFAFFLKQIADLADRDRHIPLTAKDLELLNPNSKTCPIFRSRRDAELTKAIYRRVPVLIDRRRKAGGNPWGIAFKTMFHQTNDAELFADGVTLQKQGYAPEGNIWRKGRKRYLPLYEAKMVQAYDHRAASVIVTEKNWVRQGQTEPTSVVDHMNPEFSAIPRWWVSEVDVDRTLGGDERQFFIGFKDITSPTNQRTMIAAAIPRCASTNHFVLLMSDRASKYQTCLLANLNSLVFDYIARQKIGGVTLNFFIVEQLPTLPPDDYDASCPWNPRQKLVKWISDRVLRLSCTAEDMRPLAEAAGFSEGVHRWDELERARIVAELDAAYFLLYRIDRDDVEYILGSFQALHDPGPDLFGGKSQKELVLTAFDELLRLTRGR